VTIASGTAYIRGARLVFWDFDGVIKESVEVKTRAFASLFAECGAEVTDRVRAHHEAHGGMSRFEKMPIYLRWAGVEPTEARVQAFCRRFAEIVQQEVIDAPWVAGAEAWLRRNPLSQMFVLVTATPQQEIEEIVSALMLRDCFDAVFGAPTSKAAAVRQSLARFGVAGGDAVLIGDAVADQAAAATAGVPFILRRHGSNGGLFADYAGTSVADLTEL
jgi:phosphoglycolate phosphatase-like HAD superfamily hydrolase